MPALSENPALIFMSHTLMICVSPLFLAPLCACSRLSLRTLRRALARMSFAVQLPLTFAVLVIAYLLSGLGAHVCEYMLYFLSLAGINMSVAMHRRAVIIFSVLG